MAARAGSVRDQSNVRQPGREEALEIFFTARCRPCLERRRPVRRRAKVRVRLVPSVVRNTTTPLQGGVFQVRSLGEEMRLVRTLRSGREGCFPAEAIRENLDDDVRNPSLGLTVVYGVSPATDRDPARPGGDRDNDTDPQSTLAHKLGRADRYGEAHAIWGALIAEATAIYIGMLAPWRLRPLSTIIISRD
jgi:hypothetical protein